MAVTAGSDCKQIKNGKACSGKVYPYPNSRGAVMQTATSGKRGSVNKTGWLHNQSRCSACGHEYGLCEQLK